MRYAFFSFILGLTFSANALETDNYLAWDKTLNDSSSHINRFLSESIEAALKKIPDHQIKTCEEMTGLIGKEFESHLVHDNPVENWLFSVLSDEEMYPTDLYYFEESIYREPYRFYIPWFGLAPTIQVNGFYFGTDKLSHFASTGLIYYRIYRGEIAKRKSPLSALKKAIDWGVRDEKTVHGFWASGVFSYSDLEANYQGLRFYNRFCSKTNAYLQRTEHGEWRLINRPDVAEYVSGFWDESFLLSYRKPENWSKVSAVLKSRYCPEFPSSRVQHRFTSYLKNSQRSASQNYLSSLKALPVAQSFEALCSKE